jgi:aminoglycoside phosphotransferase (APT) family kinase protein
VDRSEITAKLVRELVVDQFPQWADLPVVPVEHNGWDNSTFRLGDQLSVRLPSGDGYVAQVEKEQRWLPDLAAHLPLPIPRPVGLGVACPLFPRPWSVYEWLPGEHATGGRIVDQHRLATHLAAFLSAFYAIDASGGPLAGPHSHFRGGALSTYDAHMKMTIGQLGDRIDTKRCIGIWDAAMGSSWERQPVWVHGDLSGSNLLVVDGRLSAVIDFGCSAVGDPACDLVFAWTFLNDDAAVTFRAALNLDDDTWARAKGWALWKALITHLDNLNAGVRLGERDDASIRFSWRMSTEDLIAHLCAKG